MKFHLRQLRTGITSALGTATIALGASTTALAHPDPSTGTWGHMWGGDWGSHMGSWMGVNSGWMWLVGLIWMFIVIAVPVVLVYVFVRRNQLGDDDSALAVLREAYARGELSDEEYERRRNRLLHP